MKELKAQLLEAESRAYNLKSKKARDKAYVLVRELKNKIFDILVVAAENSKKQYPNGVKGTVERFSPGCEHYFVTGTPFGSMWISPANDILSKSWYASTCCIEYKEGQEITIQIEFEPKWDRSFLEVIPMKVTGGKINQKQYKKLCKEGKSAFFKYPDGSMSGLFE